MRHSKCIHQLPSPILKVRSVRPHANSSIRNSCKFHKPQTLVSILCRTSSSSHDPSKVSLEQENQPPVSNSASAPKIISSSSSSTPFFSPTLPQYQSGPLINIAQYAVCSTVGFASYFFLRCFNKLKVDKSGLKTLKDLVLSRPKGTPLITISNHASTVDDPFMWGLLPLKAILCNAHKMRWSLGAQEICYSNWFTSMFFSFGRVLPIIRGNGVYQEGMNSALDLMSKGHWIHVFPEGKVHQSGGILRFKWGVGRLVAESSVPPLVILIHHSGFSKIYPLTPSGMLQQWLPKLFQSIKVQVSEPIDMSHLLQQVSKFDYPQQWKIITDFLQNKMRALAAKNEGPASLTMN